MKLKQNMSIKVLDWQEFFCVFLFSKFCRRMEKALEISIPRGYKGSSSIFRTMNMDVDCQSLMNLLCKEFRALLLHEFRLGRKATRNICSTMGKDTLSIRTA